MFLWNEQIISCGWDRRQRGYEVKLFSTCLIKEVEWDRLESILSMVYITTKVVFFFKSRIEHEGWGLPNYFKSFFFYLDYNSLISESQHWTVSWTEYVDCKKPSEQTSIKNILKIKVILKNFLSPMYVFWYSSSADLVLNMHHTHCGGLNKNGTRRFIVCLNTWSSVFKTVMGGLGGLVEEVCH